MKNDDRKRPEERTCNDRSVQKSFEQKSESPRIGSTPMELGPGAQSPEDERCIGSAESDASKKKSC